MSRSLLRQQIRRIADSLSIVKEAISTDGTEREYVFFGKLVDRDALEKATSFEDQVQYRVLVPSKEKGREISVRIRKTAAWYRNEEGFFHHDPVYHLTIKSFKKGEEGCSEAESELPSNQGEALLKVFKTAGEGLIKRRYFFPVSQESSGEMVWEIDVGKEFRSSDALTRSELDDSGWVKLDLEVKQFNFKLDEDRFELPFPIPLTDVIYAQPGKRSNAEEATVRKALDHLRTDE